MAIKQRGPKLGWKPQAATVELLVEVHKVLDEYAAYLPLSVRSVCYILVGKGKLSKTKADFRKAFDAMTNARRAVDNPLLHIPMGSLSGDDLQEDEPYTGSDTSPGAYLRRELEELRVRAHGYSRDLLETQPDVIEVWCEAKGMFPQVVQAAEPYGVRCISGGGQFSLRAAYNLARRARDTEKRHIVLYLGDLDLNGVEIYREIMEDSRAWAGYYGDENDIVGERIAITPVQVTELGLESDPEEKKLNGARQRIGNLRDWHSDLADFLADGAVFGPKKSVLPAVQAEAMPPQDRAEVISAAIEDYMDLDAWEAAKDQESEEADSIAAQATGINERLAVFTESERVRISD